MRTAGRLVKLEGAGNDFILATGAWAESLQDPVFVRRLCDRHRGIGADGAFSLKESGDKALVQMDFINADGTRAMFCGNATRCAARAAVDLMGMANPLVVRTAWHDIPACVNGEQVRLELPPPASEARSLRLTTSTGSWLGEAMDFGVPHLVVRAGDCAELDLRAIAPELRFHPDLGPRGSNVSFVERRHGGGLTIRTWERGVEGETLCCGSGVAVAGLFEMAATGRRSITVVTTSGDHLLVEAEGPAPDCASVLTGPARIVAEVEPHETWMHRPD